MNFLTTTEKALAIHEYLQTKAENPATVPPTRGRTNGAFVSYKMKLQWERRMAKKRDEEVVETFGLCLKKTKRLLKTRPWIRF